ncbi:uncharacterized protein cubi_00376 [Cryptosporidium ubiquitum]|uniref:Uncharacterized protein n=1 Tax=Cryptosporidium ubiquitum TaxID=857276 RepID=A0A1J4MLB0_9CRYT|nr:uncharacterized protein cubi_00376 [Cryptosporidium ubiquitum]OII74823.1 hypothetical protein cubi_00376 [Cryptosporidium ubiquitum]
MKLSKYSRFFLGSLLGAFASTASVLGYPTFISEWAGEIRNIATTRNLGIEASQQLEELLSTEVDLDNFDVSCSILLQKVIREPSSSRESSFLNLESALDICALINPWNSMECSGVVGVTASYARSIQEFVRLKDGNKGDLRAACIIASAIAPGRPFAPLTKGSIKSKCEEVCSGVLSKTIFAIDSSYCSLSVDLCNSVDFTLYNSFSSFTERELGIAVAVSVLLSEGSLGVRTTFREGCRFVLFLKQKGAFPSVPSDISEPEILSNISEYYRAKLSESGLISVTNGDIQTSHTVFLKVLISQIAKAMRTILEAQVPKKQSVVKQKKPVVVSTRITSSEVSPLSEAYEESFSSEIVMSSKPDVAEKHTLGSPVLQSWFETLKQSIKKGSKDIDREFDDSLNKAILNIDSSSVYFTCVSELRKLGLGSHRRITEACRKIDPFSNVKCQKLNHFELMSMIKLREELEKYGKNLVVDLRDLCVLAPKMSLESFLRNRNEELSDMCIRALKKSFKNKYSVSDRAIKKACMKADYFRTSGCGNLISSQYSERVNLVLSLANNMFEKRTDKERLQAIRESEFSAPSYAEICNTVEKLPVETVEDCIYEFRDSLSKFKSMSSIINIEGACIASLEEAAYDPYYTRHGYEYGSQTYYPSIYPGHRPAGVPRRSLRRFYKDIEYAPSISSLQWFRREIPTELKFDKFIDQEYSESRRGYYKDSNNKSVYHDGYRYKLNGLWFVKIGDNWYLDLSDSLDFVKIRPSDPRYSTYPLSLYEKSPINPSGPLRRKSFATYMSPYSPQYEGRHYGNYLQELYGKPGFAPFYPLQSSQPLYKKCTKCFNWVPYGHTHKHDGVKSEPNSYFTEKFPSVYDIETGYFVTETNDYDKDGRLIRKQVDRTQQAATTPGLGQRDASTQTIQ